ncbi:MAG: HAD-IA family hydrolase [Candidatus Dormiibacterota bacterium]
MYRGAIFDVDGVLVDSPHERAWKEALQQLMDSPGWASLRAASDYTPDAFTSEVYETVLSGRPREAGALGALQHFHVPNPEQHVAEYAEKKQARLVELIDAGAFHAYPDAVRFLFAMHDLGIRTVTASSSKNAKLFLERVKLSTILDAASMARRQLGADSTVLDLLDADVSGRDFPRGKPDPMIFLAGAAELKEDPAGCFVIEDAVAGIQAALAGGMDGLAISRLNDVAMLQAANATLVLTSLDDVDLAALGQGTIVARRGTVPAG